VGWQLKVLHRWIGIASVGPFKETREKDGRKRDEREREREREREKERERERDEREQKSKRDAYRERDREQGWGWGGGVGRENGPFTDARCLNMRAYIATESAAIMLPGVCALVFSQGLVFSI